MPEQIRHNAEQRRFEYTAANGELAVCEYVRTGAVWELNHTYVPDSLRGQGIAAKLVEATLAHVRSEGGKVIPSCSYVAVFLQRHQAYADLLADGQ